jgi:hypothetical protein
MTDTKDAIRSVIQNLIKDNSDAAQVDLHPVITSKMQELVGTKKAAPVEQDDEFDDENSDTDD